MGKRVLVVKMVLINTWLFGYLRVCPCNGNIIRFNIKHLI